MPKRHKDARPSRISTRRSSGGRRRVRRHPLREGRRDRQDHDRPARGSQRLPPADADRGLRRDGAGPRGHRGRRDHPHRRGAEGVLLGWRSDGPRRHRLRRRGRLARPLPRHRPAGADATAAEAGGGDGGRLRDRRRPRPARLLRPDDRRRQRLLRADRATGRLLGRRLRRLAVARPRRDQEGEGVLDALSPVRRRGGA